MPSPPRNYSKMTNKTLKVLAKKAKSLNVRRSAQAELNRLSRMHPALHVFNTHRRTMPRPNVRHPLNAALNNVINLNSLEAYINQHTNAMRHDPLQGRALLSMRLGGIRNRFEGINLNSYQPWRNYLRQMNTMNRNTKRRRASNIRNEYMTRRKAILNLINNPHSRRH